MAECITRPLNASINVIGSALCIYLNYLYFRTKSVRGEDRDQCLYILTWFLFALILITFISWAIFDASHCIYPSITHILRLAGNVCYSLQYLVLLAMLWRRLCFVFHDSPFAVSDCTKRIFWAAYISQIVFSTLVVVDETQNGIFTELWSTLCLIFACCSVVVMICALVGLFIFKLLVMSRIAEVTTAASNAENTRHNRMELVTRLFVLTVASIVAFFVMLSIAFIGMVAGFDVYLEFIYKISLSVDAFTNLLSIALGIAELNHIYMKLCGFCQIQCVACWEKKTNVSSQSQLAHVIDIRHRLEVKSVSSEMQTERQTQIRV